jgi:hypothetical protein
MCFAISKKFLRTLLALLFIFITSNSYSADKKQSYAIKGAGIITCEQYVEFTSNKSPEFVSLAGWIDGYITAFNQFQDDTFDVAPWQSTFLLTQAIKRHCNKHPQEKFFNALTAMLKVLAPARLLDGSEIVEISSGGKKLRMYKDIVKRIQQKINTLHKSRLPIDGIYSRQTEQQLRAFQKQADLEVTGIPDQNTLQRLFH